MDAEYRASNYLSEMRNKYQKDQKFRAKIYIARLDDGILDISSKMRQIKFPSGSYCSETDVDYKGCVYVGFTTWPKAEKRFQDHLRNHKAGRGILRDFHSSTDYEECCGELTRKYGFVHLSTENHEHEKIESWVGWMLCNLGYYVWGPNYHTKEDFLLKGAFV